MFRKTLLALVLTASGLVHAQIPISGLPNATTPLGANDKIVVNQLVSGTVYSTRQAPLSALAPFFPSINSHYVLQAADPLLPQSRTLAGTANQIIITDGGALGNLTLSLPQPICVTCGPTFSILTLNGLLNGFSGVFSSTLQAASLSLTTPLQATSGGTGFGAYAVGDLLAASTTTALSKLSDVAAGSYLRSGGVGTLPLWSTLTLPNAATTGDVLIATGTNAIGNLADVTAGSYLRSNGAGAAPVYSTVKIPNTAVLGDIWYGSAANTVSALAGNITTGVQFLAQTGTGTVSAAPVWTTLPGSFTGFANPSGLIGLTAVNGVTTTATRSDATHAIDQSIAPTWTGLHIFSSGVKSIATGGFGGTVSYLASAAIPAVGWQTPGNAADQKNAQCYYNGAALQFNCTFVNDLGSVEKVWLSATRGTTTTVTGVSLGNGTDKPPISLQGATSAYEPNFSAAALRNVATYETGTFTGTLTGMTVATTGTFTYTRVGNIAFLQGPQAGLTGTSNTTAMSLTGLPAGITPTGNEKTACGGVVNNAGGDTATQCFILNTNQIVFALLNVATGQYTALFTASGSKGLNGGFSVSYPLN